MRDVCIKQLVEYGISHRLLAREDAICATNQLLEILQTDNYEDPGEVEAVETAAQLEQTLRILLNDAAERGLLQDDSVTGRDLFDTRLMSALMPRPSEVNRMFWELYDDSPKRATEYFYDLSRASDYIRTYRIEKDEKWVTDTEYGPVDITINLSKPEKDPKAIALAKSMPQTSYPKCLLCMENEGYAGRLNHPARQNHRIIRIRIQDKPWGFQYSPYVYYNEHCIVFNAEHTPMKIDHNTFEKLFDFVRQFPHYFLGSNADLPIVGGSILSHDHFQGGNYEFAMAKAGIETEITFKGFEDVRAGIVKWPMSVIRLSAEKSERLIALSDRILDAWRGYSDPDAFIFAKTDGQPHNTITPIVRRRGELFEIDLVLRNNITTEEHPMGFYHPWEEYHHIKKENIGLIEVMGLAVLPARLKEEMALLKEAVLSGQNIRENADLAKHADWVDMIKEKYHAINERNIDQIFRDEIGIVFRKILECAGVYKRDEAGKAAFLKFVEYVSVDFKKRVDKEIHV